MGELVWKFDSAAVKRELNFKGLREYKYLSGLITYYLLKAQAGFLKDRPGTELGPGVNLQNSARKITSLDLMF